MEAGIQGSFSSYCLQTRDLCYRMPSTIRSINPCMAYHAV